MPVKPPSDQNHPADRPVSTFSALPFDAPRFSLARTTDPLIAVPKRQLGLARIFAALLALVLIIGVIVVELIGSVMGGSTILVADALLFTANGLQILAALIAPRTYLPHAKLFLAGLIGILAIALGLWAIYLPTTGALPEGFIIAPIAIMALGVHIGIAFLLTAFEADEDQRVVFKTGARNDIVLTLIALVAGILIWRYEFELADMIGALLVAAAILYSSWQRALSGLDEIDNADEAFSVTKPAGH